MQRTTVVSVRWASFWCRPTQQRRRVSLKADGYPRDFTFLPNFYSLSEQQTLLSAALKKLDTLEGRQYRRCRKEYLSKSPQRNTNSSIQDVFLPDEFYCFEDGHYDGVIRRFREMHVSSWSQDSLELRPLLDRLLSVHPLAETQTHLLHLASDGEILPHVDNLGASGSWILGVCLGSTRMLRLENTEDSSDSYELQLPSGCVYMQKDSLRYGYKHSVLRAPSTPGVPPIGEQRMTILVRDHLPPTQ